MSPAGRRRLVRLACMATLLSGSAALTVFALRDNLTFFYTPSQVHAQGLREGHVFRLGGKVERGSLRQRPGSLWTEFVVVDERRRLPVRYQGLLPDLFGEDKGVVASGRLSGEGVFLADQVLAKHDETYRPPESGASAKSRPDWIVRAP